ncbi:MAG: hypothetical protein PHD48_07950, partial [Alphaproteobacteria bacterium]|nr:hypothetical protein [Alphaproteobacteria bacterium]
LSLKSKGCRPARGVRGAERMSKNNATSESVHRLAGIMATKNKWDASLRWHDGFCCCHYYQNQRKVDLYEPKGVVMPAKADIPFTVF